MTDLMKAMMVPRYGAPEVLELREIPKPKPGPDEILIRARASTVSSGDLPRRSGRPLINRLFFGLTRPKPEMRILGSEIAGVVVEVGADVERFKVGDEVFAITDWSLGGNAEFKRLPERGAIALKPRGFSFEEIAALPFGAGTALHFLRRGGVRADQEVLIYGASGCVGSYAVQLARWMGARVTGVCSARNLERVRSLGAARVIDYTAEDFTQGEARYDVIFDAVRKQTYARCARALAPGGLYLTVDMRPLDFLRRRVICGIAHIKAAELETLKGLVEAGELKPVIDQRWTLEALAEAHRYVETGRKRGSVVISMV